MKLINRSASILSIFLLIMQPGRACLSAAGKGAGQKLDAPIGVAGLKSPVEFSAKDSLVYNLESKTMELWGRARLNHGQSSIRAPQILVELDKSLVRASGAPASSERPAEQAFFSDRAGSFTADAISYNIRSGRGETANVSSSSPLVTFTGREVTRKEGGELSISEGTFTTCDLEEPHYWFSASRMSVIPDKKITASSLVMYLHPELFSRRLPAIPVLFLPYMEFPLEGVRSSGLLSPGFGSDSERGFYLSHLGYFWAASDNLDLRLEGDISVNGSWRLADRARYTKPGELKGEVTGEYRSYPSGRDWNASMVHNQIFDPTARLDVNARLQGGSRPYLLTTINQSTVLSEQADGRASFAKTFNDENAIAALFYSRSEDLRNRNSASTLGASFYQNRIYPFRSDSLDDWRGEISFGGGASLAGDFAGIDSRSLSDWSAGAEFDLGYYREFSGGSRALFTQAVALQRYGAVPGFYESAFNGTSVTLPLRVQSTLFSHFNLNSGLTFVNYRDMAEGDTGFSTTVFSTDASTRLYSKVDTGALDRLFGLKALRHTFIPTLSYTWNPSFAAPQSDAYRHLYDWTGEMIYNRVEMARSSGLPEGQSTLSLTLKNLFQGKIRESAASGLYEANPAEHSIQLLSLSLSTGYNFAAEQLKMQPLVLSAESNALSENLLFSAGSIYDFYGYDPATGSRINRWNGDDGGGLLRFVKGFLNMSVSLQGESESRSASPAGGLPYPLVASQMVNRDRLAFGGFTDVDYRLPWQLQLSLLLQSDKSNPLLPERSALVNTSLRAGLSQDWQLAVSTGYDLHQRELAFPMLQLHRNLHCWQVSFQWVPSGQYRSYAVQIGLSAPKLKDFHFRQSGRLSGE
ncbi:MAG: putative LPS assembly protein LptD [Chlorobiaceae bacterium]